MFWNDIEILRFIDACEQGERSLPHTGAELVRTLAADRGVGVDQGDYARFLHELDVLGKAELLGWEMVLIPAHVRQPTPAEPQWYLDHMCNFALTYTGRNQAKGRVIYEPPPDPEEDDGRPIASLTLEDVARSIGARYTRFQAFQFFIEAGISYDYKETSPEIDPAKEIHVFFVGLATGASKQRRELRHFLGAWLDDRLHTGPSYDERVKIVGDLAKQGWFVEDGRLVVGAKTYRPPAPVLDQLHPTVWNAADPQWKVKHFHDAVDDAGKAVNAMLQAKVGRNDASEGPLVESTFSPHPPKTGEPRLRFPNIADAKTRDSMTAGVHRFGVGCFKAIRNPLGHLPTEQHDITPQEALEQLAAWSQFARWIDRAEVVES
jgi:hypothetical protein